MGHTDTLVITLDAVLAEMQVERAIIAEEMTRVSPQIYTAIHNRLGDAPIDLVPHETFKAQTGTTRAVMRTGEFTLYANLINVKQRA